MRMAPDHFFSGGTQQGFQIAPAILASDQAEKEHGIEQVAELFLKRAAAPASDRIKDFPGFFDEVGKERCHGLRAVPGTAAGCVQALGRGDQVPEGIIRQQQGRSARGSGLTHQDAYVIIRRRERSKLT